MVDGLSFANKVDLKRNKINLSPLLMITQKNPLPIIIGIILGLSVIIFLGKKDIPNNKSKGKNKRGTNKRE